MNNPKPTLKNLRQGLVAIKHIPQTDTKQLNFLLSIAWPLDLPDAAGGNKYYYKSLVSEDIWVADNTTNLHSYSVLEFIESCIPQLTKEKEAAEEYYDKARIAKKQAGRSFDVAYTKLNMAVELSATRNVKHALANNREAKKKVDAVFAGLDSSLSVNEFCAKLEEIQNILKQIP
jgi:tRNA A37 N6-isopentenylltransferase MiaA